MRLRLHLLSIVINSINMLLIFIIIIMIITKDNIKHGV